MIEELAIVTRTNAGQVWIKSLPGGACGACMQHAQCGTAALAKVLPKREFALCSELSLQAGDTVRVAIDDSRLLFGSALVYLVPLLFMFISVLGFNALFPDLKQWSPELSLCALLSAFGLIHRFQSYLLVSAGYQAVIVGVNAAMR